ncbi:alpha/beta hydrolase [Paludisphaera rhizosphaerae]|uniref:alpha/beta hydrolase n=1 Tax=Paludisphaera rhizosphaerae TaxID=2711216 RepID=UPI0013ECB888|nr:alpha/beta fold hydrolase [Paludisphaera rhizosphaerae]
MDDPIRPALLILHGLGGGPYELQPLLDALLESGRRVEAPTLPGHDGAGPVMPASTWPEWTDAAERWFDQLAAEGRPVAVVGFSTGGLIALHLATRRPVERLALIAPFFAVRYTDWLPFRVGPIVRTLAYFVPNPRRRSPAVRDPEARRRLAKLDRFRTFSLPAAASALELIEAVEPTLPTVAAPTLIVQGDLDTVVEPARAARLLERLGSSRKRLVALARSDHLALHDRDRDQALAEIIAFLNEDLGE